MLEPHPLQASFMFTMGPLSLSRIADQEAKKPGDLFEDVLNNYEENSASSDIQHLIDDLGGILGDGDARNGIRRDGSAGSQDRPGLRFVYFSDGVCIDINHFFTFGDVANDYGMWAFAASFLSELHQWLHGQESGAPFGGNEDIESNLQGIDFSWSAFDSPFAEDGLGNQVRRFLENRFGPIRRFGVGGPGTQSPNSLRDLGRTAGRHGHPGSRGFR